MLRKSDPDRGPSETRRTFRSLGDRNIRRRFLTIGEDAKKSDVLVIVVKTSHLHHRSVALS
jgi:hypothetical protein